MKDGDKIPFTAHLEELRKRLVICCVAIGIGVVIAYGFKEKLFEILTLPLIREMRPGDKLIFTGLTEAFFTYMKVSFLAGIMLASPVIIYQFWAFVGPGLYQKERRYFVPIVLLSLFFFAGGSFFCFFVVFPFAFKFFLSFATDVIQPLPSMKEYLSFASVTMLAFGLVFELPLVIVFLARLGVVTVDFLRKNRKYAILLIFLVAAILTPGPDVVSQVLMAFPLMFLYEISIVGAIFLGKKKEKKTDG
ncbi:MAG: twin-arginine translocase subunit TatC [Desulfobacterales bacterium]|nr:twin-arginine translocase subunit TatC [Desulfobacterales bacterium]